MEVCDYLGVGNIIILLLFILSEVLGKSKCKANSVVELVWECTCSNAEEE